LTSKTSNNNIRLVAATFIINITRLVIITFIVNIIAMPLIASVNTLKLIYGNAYNAIRGSVANSTT
jgi:hypothetical protein